MAFGEEIGDAFIEVHADSRPFRREIRRDARRAGRDAGVAFDDGFQSELGDTFSNLGKNMERRIKKGGFNSGREFANAFEDGVKRRLKSFNRDLGDALVTGDFSRVIKQWDTLDKAAKGVDKRLVALRRGGRLTKREFDEARKSFKAFTDEIRKSNEWEKMVEEAIKEDKRFTKEMNKQAKRRKAIIDREVADNAKAVKRMERERQRALEETADAILTVTQRGNDRHVQEIKQHKELERRRRKEVQQIEKNRKAREKEFATIIKGWRDSKRGADAFARSTRAGERALQRMARAYRRTLTSDNDRALFDRAFSHTRHEIIETDKTFTRRTRSLGNALRGSRNDFLHFFGIVIGGMERLGGRITEKAFSVIGNGISGIGDLVAKNGGPLGKFGDKLGSVGESIAAAGGKSGWIGLAVTVGALAAAFAAIIPVVGAFVSLISGLVGILAALASTITVAVMGALGSLLPMLGGLALGVGALVIAFVDLKGEFEFLKKTTKPLVDTFKRVQTNLQEAFGPAIRRVVEKMAAVLERLEPVFIALGDAVLAWLESFADLMNSPVMGELLGTFSDTLPGVIKELGRFFNAVFLAIAAIIAAAAPVVENFLSIMSDAAMEWAEWAASPEGQTQLRDWFESAAEAAQILWDVLGGLIDVISAVFDAGRDDGDNMWKNIGDNLREFADWLRTDEGQEKLREWYDRAMDLASALGDLATAISDMVTELDDAQSSGALQGIISAFTFLFQVLEWGGTAWQAARIELDKFSNKAKEVAGWFNQNVVIPIQYGLQVLEMKWKSFQSKVSAAWFGIQAVITVVWTWIESHVINPMKLVISTVEKRWKDFQSNVSKAWYTLQTTLWTIWTWMDQNIFKPIQRVITGLVLAFNLGVTAIGMAWARLKRAVAEPVNAVIRIYRTYVKEPFEKVADSVGLKWRLPTVPEIKYASGGVLPGYTPGRDVHDFYSPSGGRLSLSGGEAIMRPEWTRAVGGPKAVAEMNRRAKRGQAFASGGVFGRALVAGDSNGNPSVIDRLAGLLSKGASALDNLASLFTNPKEVLKNVILTPLSLALKNVPGGKFGDLMGGITTHLAKALVDKFAEGVVSATPPGAGAASGPIPGGWATMWRIVKAAFPDANLHSGFRPGAITATGYPSMHGKGRAIDISPRADIFNWLRSRFPGSYELIFSPMGARQLYKGRSYVFPEPTRSMHYNHIHWAMKNGGVFDPTAGIGSSYSPSEGSDGGTGLPVTARGGVFSGAQARIIGEAGDEAVVPLSRPLSQVDPAVRPLAAAAQGRLNGKVDITVVSPYANPHLVALETVDALANGGAI